MSELKEFNSERIYWAVEQVERKAGDIENLHLDDNLFYIKSDFDSYIDKLNTEYTKKMLQLTRDNEPDYERAHSDADDLLCELLRKLGFDSVVNAFDEVGKWYA